MHDEIRKEACRRCIDGIWRIRHIASACHSWSGNNTRNSTRNNTGIAEC